MKELKFDELFHLFMVVKLSNGKTFHIEKNQRIEVYEGKVAGETMEVPIKQPINVLDFFEKTKKRMGNNFYVYDASNNNCQYFIDNLLSANGINSDSIRKFVKQDTESLFKRMPEYVKIISKRVTDAGGALDEAVHGNGKKYQ